MKLGFTGTQSGMTKFQRDCLNKVITMNGIQELIHGDCIGSDEQANDIGIFRGLRLFSIYPPDNPKKRAWCFNSKMDDSLVGLHNQSIIKPGENYEVRINFFPKLPYLIRNQNIVNDCNILVACPKEFKHTVRSGTWATIRLGWKRERIDPNFKVIIIPPIEREEDVNGIFNPSNENI